MNGKPFSGRRPGNFPTMENTDIVALAGICSSHIMDHRNRGCLRKVSEVFKMGHDQVQSIKVAYSGINTVVVYMYYALYTFPSSECKVWKLATNISSHSYFPIRKSNGKSGPNS